MAAGALSVCTVRIRVAFSLRPDAQKKPIRHYAVTTFVSFDPEDNCRGEWSTQPASSAAVINAMVPLANMFGYVNTLRSMSQGRATFTMVFDHYDQVPQAVADEVVAKMA